MSQKKRRVGVIFGGRSGEHEVSLMSARSVLDAIDKDRYEVVPIGITKTGRWLPPARAQRLLTGEAPSAVQDAEGQSSAVLAPTQRSSMVVGSLGGALGEPLDVVFPVLHGPYGEDGTMQGFLDLANIPYVGAGVLGSALGMDKGKMKEVWRYHGLPVVDWTVLRRFQWREDRDACLREASRFGFPCFVKPANLGSSVGIGKAHDAAELPACIEEALRHDEKVIVEEFVDGREIEVAVLGNHKPEASIPGEIVPSNEFYDYNAKYLDGKSEERIPAPLPSDIAERVRELAVKAFTALECSGMGRVDFFVTRLGNEVLLNEINTIPGFTPISMYPKLWAATGLPYDRLIDRLIELAIERWEERNQNL
ncbi:MAG TPA: D-alanine--D-alanine ligase family protein [Chloroflexota bacterium]|nr:D-alanine--D-alanine ligase family protein [Chloroflexota bacterium]